jgi:SAM-dependent methyltransferase
MSDGPRPQQVFARIYKENRWNSDESASGKGSTLKSTELLRGRLSSLLRDLDIRTLVDAPCGDLNWMRHLDYTFSEYIGVDIVPDLVQRLRNEIVAPNWRFIVGDISSDVLPAADALLCRDCLGHLPYELALCAIENWKRAGFTYIITTTFPGETNREGALGRWRRINMEAPPFCFPDPVAVIAERFARPERTDPVKSLGCWRTVEIP